MDKTNESPKLIVTLNVPLSGNWEKDKAIILEAAGQPTPADNYFNHAAAIEALFNTLTYGTPAQPEHPMRKGLLKEVHDELYPIAHFAKLYFTCPNNVVVRWISGNQRHDAIVEYKEGGSNQSDISYLEVTTLKGKEEADELKKLSMGSFGTVMSSNAAQAEHDRKIDQLRRMLEKKAAIDYPNKTALLVYTDENRLQNFHFGVTEPKINKKETYETVLQEFKPSLQNFSYVFIFSKNEIYCTLTNSR